MRRVFHDHRLDADFSRLGYVVIENFLSRSECEELEHFYLSRRPESMQGFHATMYLNNEAWRAEVRERVFELYRPKLPRWFVDYECCCGNFMTKEPDPRSMLPLHQDWTHVEEPRFRSAHIWVPTVETTPANGCLALTPGSHRLGDSVRAFADDCPFREQFEFITSRFLKRMPVKAGTAIIYDGGVLHGSDRNQTEKTRVAVQCITTPAEATMTHAVRLNADQVAVYKVTPDFFLKYQLGEIPSDAPVLRVVDYRVRQRTRDEVLSLENYSLQRNVDLETAKVDP